MDRKRMPEADNLTRRGAREILPHPSAVYGELEYRLQQQAVVAELGRDALLGVDLDVLFDKAVERVAKVLNNEYCKVLELLPGGDYVFLRAGVGWREGLVRQATVDTGLNSQAGYTLMSKEPVVVRDLRTESRFNGPPLLQEHGVVSGMSVIIHGHNGPWGVLGTHTKRYHEFTQDDINFFQSVSNILANALERKRAETELKEAAEMLEQRVHQRTKQLADAKQELVELACVVSHELQSPVRLIVSNQGLLSARYKGKLGPDADNFLSVITSSARQVERMVDDLWVYARVDSGTSKAATVDATQVLKKAIDSLNDVIEASGAQIAADKLPAVLAVPTQLEYVFAQLIRNAITFRSANTPLINISYQRQSGYCCFCVKDNGIGFDMMDAQSVFKMFHRLHGNKYPGTGMGLAICKKIIETNSGNIWVQSEPQKGSSFYFTVPSA